MKEYWIVDPTTRKITLLSLQGREFRVVGEFVAGQAVTSTALPELSIDVSGCFAAAERAAPNDEPRAQR